MILGQGLALEVAVKLSAGLQPYLMAQLREDPVLNSHMWLMAGLNFSRLLPETSVPPHRIHYCSQNMTADFPRANDPEEIAHPQDGSHGNL